MSEQIDFYINVISALISIVGFIDNIMNVAIFCQLGLKDSMSVGLLLLSLTDFLFCFFALGICTCFIMSYLFPENKESLVAVMYVALVWNRDNLYFVSSWITTLLSVERCVCVVLPFQVKQLFTRTRCLCAVLAIYAIIFCLHVPVYSTQRLVWKTENKTLTTYSEVSDTGRTGDILGTSGHENFASENNPATNQNWTDEDNISKIQNTAISSSDDSISEIFINGTNAHVHDKDKDIKTVYIIQKHFLKAAFSDNRAQIDVYSDILTSLALPLPPQIIVIVCAVLLVIGLHRSSRVRQHSYTETSGNNADTKLNITKGDNLNSNRKHNMPDNACSVDLRDEKLLNSTAQERDTKTVSGYIFDNLNTPVKNDETENVETHQGHTTQDGSAFSERTTNIQTTEKQRSKASLSARETRLVKVVICLAIVLTICNVPRVIATFSTYIFPSINLGGSDEDIYLQLWNIAVMFGAINSSVNTFIYLIVNHNFRKLTTSGNFLICKFRET